MDLLKNSPLQTKKCMLVTLQNNILTEESSKQRLNKESVSNLVQFVPSFISDDVLSDGLWAELSSMPSLLGESNKIKSQWVSLAGEPYTFGNKKYDPIGLDDFPCIKQLLDIVNSDPLTEGKLNSCLINKYSSHAVAHGSPHADNEVDISQSSSIVTVSLGASRRIQFTTKNDGIVKSLDLEENSAFFMMPGCQQVLKHQIMKRADKCKVRYSISFREAVPVPTKAVTIDAGTLLVEPDTPESKSSSGFDIVESFTTPDIACPREDCVLIIGDSISKRLNPKKLGKNKIKVRNISESGYNIKRTEESVDKFYCSSESQGLLVKKLFISIGTNDIRYCYGGGIKHLRAPFMYLAEKLKRYFPEATIYVHTVLPIKVVNQYTITNVYDFNTMLLDCCHTHKLKFLDFCRDFLDDYGYRKVWLFYDDVHPNRDGYAVIASRYINIIHNKWFDPFVLGH